MKTVKLLFFFIFIIVFTSVAQTHWIIFTDKNGTYFNPYEYFDSKAIERRIEIGYDLYHISDYPVNTLYIETVRALCDSTSYAVRWLNALSVWASDEQLAEIKKLEFVKEVIPIYSTHHTVDFKKMPQKVDTVLLINQIQSMEGNLFAEAGINGQGVRIAILDGGFTDVDTHPAFEHIRNESRIKSTYDFVRKRDFVYSFNIHGTMVMSNIGGMYNGKPMGLATGAEFLLARTEKNTEPFSEEVNWAAALEWADKNGAHIVNSSLGYIHHRYFPYEMNGQTAFVSRMANTAASKGILVVNAAGNEGMTRWAIIGAPADADSILTVGGINPDTDYKINFSSVGPTSDFRRKPNVVAYGKTVAATKKDKTTIAFGTSFASPLVAGFAACVKQIHPKLYGMELKAFIEQSGNLYPYFDYSHGHGIPIASKAMNTDIIPLEPNFTFKVTENNYFVKINDNEKIAKYPVKTYNNYFYFAYINDKNIICEWGIIIVTENSFNIQKPLKCENIKQLQMHFRGYTYTFNFS